MAALIDVAQECGTLVVTPQEICITLPGAVDVCVNIPDPTNFPDPIELVKGLFTQLNAALTPLTPFFNLLDLVITLVKCVQAIPDGPTEFPPFKTLITECIPELPEKIAKILALIPPLALPITILGFIDALIVLLEGFIGFLNRVVSTIANIVDAQTRAAELGSFSLTNVADCADENAELEMTSFNESLGPLNLLFGLIDVFIGLAQIPGVSGLPQLSDVGIDPLAALDPINDFLDAIKVIRGLIPL